MSEPGYHKILIKHGVEGFIVIVRFASFFFLQESPKQLTKFVNLSYQKQNHSLRTLKSLFLIFLNFIEKLLNTIIN